MRAREDSEVKFRRREQPFEARFCAIASPIPVVLVSNLRCCYRGEGVVSKGRTDVPREPPVTIPNFPSSERVMVLI